MLRNEATFLLKNVFFWSQVALQCCSNTVVSTVQYSEPATYIFKYIYLTDFPGHTTTKWGSNPVL